MVEDLLTLNMMHEVEKTLSRFEKAFVACGRLR